MSSSIYSALVPVSVRALNNLDHIISVGEKHAADRDMDPAVLVSARLFPDMFPLSAQVQIATDVTRRGAQRLAGIEPPAMDDLEANFDALHERIRSSVDAMTALDAAAFDGAETREVTIMTARGEMTFNGHDFVFGFVLPNLYFHVTTAYNILRHNGVPLGKVDYLGEA